jgi:hypothetical protein
MGKKTAINVFDPTPTVGEFYGYYKSAVEKRTL